MNTQMNMFKYCSLIYIIIPCYKLHFEHNNVRLRVYLMHIKLKDLSINTKVYILNKIDNNKHKNFP